MEKNKTIHFRVNEETHSAIKAAAQGEGRSISNYILWLIAKAEKERRRKQWTQK